MATTWDSYSRGRGPIPLPAMEKAVDKVEVCIRHQQGWSLSELAREFGVSYQRIQNIVKKGRVYWYDRRGLRGRPARPDFPEEYLEELRRYARRED